MATLKLSLINELGPFAMIHANTKAQLFWNACNMF